VFALELPPAEVDADALVVELATAWEPACGNDGLRATDRNTAVNAITCGGYIKGKSVMQESFMTCHDMLLDGGQ